MMRKLSLLLLLALLMVTCTGCSLTLSLDEEKADPLPEETVEAFEKAVNNIDVQGMLDCMSEDMQSSLTSALDIVLKIASKVTGFKITDYVSAEDLINVSPLLQGLIPNTDYGDMASVDYEVHTTYIKGDKATVYFTEVSSGQSMVINMIKEDDKWVFAMTTTPLTQEEAERVIIDGVEQAAESETESSSDAITESDIYEWLEEFLSED